MEDDDFAMVLGRFEGRRGGEAARATTKRSEANDETSGALAKLLYRVEVGGGR